MENPLINAGDAPDFAKITPAHFLPAQEAEIEKIQAALLALKADTSAPSFANTVLPLESLFAGLVYIGRILGMLSANTYTKEIGKIEEEVNIRSSAIRKTVFQDAQLGARFRAVYDARETLGLDEDDQAVLRHLYNAFESSGALLSAEGQAEIREIDKQLITLTQKFHENMQEAPLQQAVLVTDAAELAGLGPNDIEGMAENARKHGHENAWMLIPERLQVDELLERAEHSGFRKKMFMAVNNLGKFAPYDNAPVIAEILRLRQRFATLLGYPDYATYARSRAMKKELSGVHAFLKKVSDKALPKFEADMRALEKFSSDKGGPAQLEPWDVSYWAMQQRAALYHFDTNAFAQYLPLGNVMRGMFSEAAHLFGLAFTETGKFSTVHPDIRVYAVTDARSSAEVGLLHVDMFARPGEKGGGAWMNHLQRKAPGRRNVIGLNMNIAKPPAGREALISLSQYITLYHEMGHALQGLLGTNVKHLSLQGTAGPSDFVEFHSMVNERRALLRKNLESHALHVETGQPASAATIDALLKSKAHFSARELLKIVQNSLRDLAYHEMQAADYKGDAALEDSVAMDTPYAEHIRPYPLTRFSHLFGAPHAGYAAGYVNYLIAEEHAADGFVPFESDPYGAEWSAKLDALYRRGCGGDPAALYRAYRGADATTDALLHEAGIAA